jgi:predicted nucleotidyltransferase
MIETHKNSIIRLILRAMPNVRAIYLFGSWGKPFQREDSDIDVAILPSAPIDNVQRWELAQEAARNMKRDVDLVDLLGATTVLRY